jgi:hypothetical protein
MANEAKALAKKVVEMRTAWRIYARRKSKSDFIRAKVLDRELDEMCDRIIRRKEQATLWDQP